MRDCESCKNHTDKGCTKWKCEFEPTTKNDLGVDWDELKRKIFMEVDGGTDDRWLRYGDVCDNISNSIDDFKANMPSVTPQEPKTFKWCDTCKEYDHEKHCCHRWSKVIRDTIEEMNQEQELILDKIRAEIEKWHKDGTNWSDIRLMEIEDILDKVQGRK